MDRTSLIFTVPPVNNTEFTCVAYSPCSSRVVINRKLGEGAFGTVFGGEAFFDEKGWVSERC